MSKLIHDKLIKANHMAAEAVMALDDNLESGGVLFISMRKEKGKHPLTDICFNASGEDFARMIYNLLILNPGLEEWLQDALDSYYEMQEQEN